MKKLLFLLITTMTVGIGLNAQCLVEVTLTDNGFTDEINWTLVEDATSTVVASGGPYGVLPDVQSYLGTGPYTFTIGDPGCSFCDNTIDYSITVGGLPVASGTYTGSGTAGSITELITTPCPSCSPPSALGASGITTTSAILNWTSGGSGETNWDVEIGATPYVFTGTPTVGYDDITNPVTATGLSPATTYEYWVRADCDGALGTDESVWTGPFSFTTNPTCIQPSALTATGITTTTADLSWTSGGSGETNWDIEIGATPYVFTGTPTAGYDDITNPVTATGLSPATTYEYWVRADCDGALGTDESTWAGPFSFTTPCVAFVAPYAQNFDSGSAGDFNNSAVPCWTAIGPGANDLDISTTTDFGLAPPSLPNIVEFNDGSLSGGDTSILVSPSFSDLPTGLNRIRFTTGFESAVVANVTLIVGVMTDPNNSSTFIPIDTLDASDVGGEDQFGVVAINLDNTGLIGSAQHVAFMHGPGAFEAYLDDFFYEPIPSCLMPTALAATGITTTTADLSWTSGGSGESNWDVEIGAAPYVFTGTPTAGYDDISNPVTATGLSPATTYEYWVRADCDAALGTDESTWAGPFSFTTVPSCIQPTALTATGITTTTADLSWTSGGSGESNWDIEIGATPYVFTGTPTAGYDDISNPVTATGLSPATTYEYWVRADCDAALGTDESTWAGPFSFTTPCVTFVAPYTENFDAALVTPNCWTNTPGGEPWSFGFSGMVAFPAPDYGVAGAVDHTSGTGNYTWIDASGGGIGVNELISPVIDFSGLTSPQVGYWIFSNNIDDGAQNTLELYAWDGAAWDLLNTYGGNNAAWTEVAIPIPGTIPTTTQFRLVQVTSVLPGDAFFNDLLVDDFFVNEAPACPAPVPSSLSAVVTLPSTVDLSWSTSGPGNTYTVEYRVVGSPTWIAAPGNPYAGTTAQLTGLSADNFEWQVASNCAGPLTSLFSSGVFTTIPFPGACATAEVITAGTYSAPGPSTGGGASNNCFGAGGTNANWYEYTATVSGSATVSSDLAANTGLDTRVSVYEGSCGTLTCVAQDDDGGSGFLSVADFTICAGTTYYIEWDDRWDTDPFDFTLSETAACTDPGTASITPTLDGFDGTTSWTAGGGTCGGGYEWEVVADGAAAFSGNAIASGTGAYPVSLAAVTGLMSATPYDLYVRDVCGPSFSNDVLTNFTTLSPPPVNDDCADAIVVFGGYSVTGFSTLGSTTEATGLTSCVFSATNAVWFQYTPTCDVTFEINTNGTSALPNGYDTQISLWDDCSYANELACDDDGGVGLNSLITFAGIANTTYYIRVSGFGGQTGEVNFQIIEQAPGCACTQNVWTGATSNDWSDGTNWTCGTAPTNNCASPAGSDIAIIPAGSGVTPVVSGTQGGASLSVGAGSSIIIDGTLQICGNVVHNGNALTGAGDLELVGTATQMLSGNGAFGYVELTNAAGATVMGGANLSVDSALTLTTGTFTNNGSFSLNSSIAGTAYLDDFTGTGVYSGDLTVNRFITDGFAGGLGQRYFGSAVSGSTVSDLDPTYASGFPVNGFIMPIPTCDPDSIMPASPYSNLMEWREDATFPTSCVQEGWWALPTISTNLTPGRGYSGWMNNGSTISVTGAPNTGGQSYTTTNSASNTTTAQGWHVLSNPYPSPMNVNAVTSSGLTSPQYYDASSGPWSGTFQPVLVAGVEVPVMQGFTAFSAGAGSFAPDNSFRVASTNANFAKSNNWFDYRLDVELTMGNKGDITYLYYSGSSTDQFDAAGDCVKRESDIGNPTLYTTNNGEKMSLNGLNLNDLGTSVPMGLIAPTAVNSVFSFSGMNDFPANTSIYLEDKVEGIFHDLADGDYTFQADPSENGTERFEIHFVLPASFNLIEATCENTNGTIVENTTDGRTFAVISNNTVVDNGTLDGSSNELAAGDYTIEVYDQFGGSQLYDFTIEEVTAVSAAIISSASAIEAGESINFEFNGADATTYEWRINGQVVAQTEMFSYQFVNPGQYAVELYAANDMCEAIASSTVEVAEKTTSIAEVGNGSLAIYGSEGNVVLNFVNVNQGKVNAAVYNLLGQEVASLQVESSGKQMIQNVNWAAGYYLVKVQIGEQVVNETVMLTK